MWNKNKNIIQWIITLIGSGLIAWGVAKTKIENMQTQIDELKSNNEKITNLRVDIAKTQTELDALEESNKQEHRTFKRKEQ
jgi:hypothetical protein